MRPAAEFRHLTARLPTDAPPDLVDNAIFIKDTDYDLSLKGGNDFRSVSRLVTRFIRQLTQGCGNQHCTNEACYTYRERSSNKPNRKLTSTSARATAVYLASSDDPESHLCSPAAGGGYTSSGAAVFRLVRRDGSIAVSQSQQLQQETPTKTETFGSSKAISETSPTDLYQVKTSNPDANGEVVTPNSIDAQRESNAGSGVAASKKKIKRDAKSFAQQLFERRALKLLELQPDRNEDIDDAMLTSYVNGNKNLPQCLDHIDWKVTSELDKLVFGYNSRLKSINSRQEEQTLESLMLFIQQSCYYIFSRYDGIVSSFRDLSEQPNAAKSLHYDNWQSNRKLLQGKFVWQWPHFGRRRSDPLLRPGLLNLMLRWWLFFCGDLVFNSICKTLDSLIGRNGSKGQQRLFGGRDPKEVAHVLHVCLFTLLASGPRVHDKSFEIAKDDIQLACSSEPASRVIRRLVRLIARYSIAEHADPATLPGSGGPFGDGDHIFGRHVIDSLERELGAANQFYPDMTGYLRVWLRHDFLSHWDGRPLIDFDSAAGEALRVVRILFDRRLANFDDNGWDQEELEDILDLLDPVDLAKDRVSASEDDDILHIGDFPFLFRQSTLVENFRAACFLRMATAVDKADLVFRTVFRSINEQRRFDMMARELNVASSSYLNLSVHRRNLVTEAFSTIWKREKRELLRPLKVKISNEGEEGVDEGGVAQEFFRLLFAEVCVPDYAIFTLDARTRMMWFNPACMEPLWRIEALGLLVALAVYNGFTCPFTFPDVFYRKLLGDSVSSVRLADLQDGWDQLVTGLTCLLEWKDGEVEDVFCRTFDFSFEAFGKVVNVDMDAYTADVPWTLADTLSSSSAGPPSQASLVTNENRERYVDAYIAWLVDRSIRPQFEAFARGFHSILEPALLASVDSGALRTLVEGHQAIDVHALSSVTRYDGYTPRSHIIRSFWAIVEQYSETEQKRLLEFVTASNRLPVNGMASIEFVIQRNGPDSEQLPSSSTCFGRLLLPEYASEQKLRDKLSTALDNSVGFGLR